MSVLLTNKDNKLAFNYIVENGIVKSSSDGKLLSGNKVTINDLETDIQTKLTDIDTISSNISQLQNTVSNLPNQSGISLDDTISTSNNLSSSLLSNFAKQWTQCTNAGTANVVDFCCSGDGRVVLLCAFMRGNSQLSTDYGETWTTPSGLSNSILSCSMDLDGKHIILSDMYNYKISSDFGRTFQMPNNRPFQLQRSALSATGKYIVCGCGQNQGLQVSTDYGQSWVKRETTTWTWNDVAISLDGSIIYGCSDSGLIKKSIDYGQTWSTIYTNSSSNSIKSMCCSGDGKYILAAFQPNSQLLLSSDYGVTFNLVGTSASYHKVRMSKNGIYMIASVNGSALYYSTNYGSNWNSISYNEFCEITMSYNGELTYNIAPDKKPLLSTSSHNLFRTVQPTIPSSGSVYFDPVTNKLNIFNGSIWKSVTFI